MKKINLKPFQIKAIEELLDEFIHRFKKSTRQTIKFQAPTGSGKTIMMAQFVKELVNSPRIMEENLGFLWVSIGGSKDEDLTMQSRDKFFEYYGGASEIEVSDLSGLSREKVLAENEILFFNWSKIKTSNKEGRKLRREGETEVTWDGMLERTKNEGRNIVLFIDESHRETSSELSKELIDQIDPKITVEVTATHRGDQENIGVRVEHKDVVDAGLIRESIKSQTREEFEDKKDQDLDRFVLDLALQKRKDLKEIYEQNKIDVNPLLMIQLPNDEKKDMEEKLQKDIVLGYLKEKNIDKNKIAVWLDKEKTNLENITKSNSDTQILLFKQAPATGWDCPRAQVMLMYRETKSTVFQIQLLGRILRTSEGKKYLQEKLNHSYLYTTYAKNEIIEGYEKFKEYNTQGENKTELFHTKIKEGIEQIKLETNVSQRVDYNDLGLTFQKVFLDTAISLVKTKKDLENAGFFVKNQLNLDLIVDQRILNFDSFIKRVKEQQDFDKKMSHHDIDKLYKKLCVHVLLEQEEKGKFGNIARSYGILKSALNVFFEEKLKLGTKEETYEMIVKDLVRGANSVLIPIINKALINYKPIREREVEKKAKKLDEKKEILIPRSKVGYTGLYEKIKTKKCAMEECFFLKDGINVRGIKNEKDFIEFLEGNENVEWWYKNGDNGTENFSVKREDGRLFFPDWFVKTKKDIWILDTKKGDTAEGEGAKKRAKALEVWLKENKTFKGGLVKPESSLWKIARDSDLKEWENFKF